MENHIQIYERIYKNAFDLISEIGGLIQIIFYIFFWINYIYNKYIVAYDTYSLFFFVQDENLNHKKGLRNIFIDLKLNSSNRNNNKPKKYSLELSGHNRNKFLYFNTNKNNIINNLNRRKNTNYNITGTNYYKKNIKTDQGLKKAFAKQNDDVFLHNIYELNKKKMNTDENCSCDKLNNNNNILLNRLNLEHKENEFEDKKMSSGFNNNAKHIEKYNKKSSKSIRSIKSSINEIVLSQKSINKIEHNNLKFKLILNKENRKSVMRFAFIDSVKSCCFKRNKGSPNNNKII
jgi:hypothetical protein